MLNISNTKHLNAVVYFHEFLSNNIRITSNRVYTISPKKERFLDRLIYAQLKAILTFCLYQGIYCILTSDQAKLSNEKCTCVNNRCIRSKISGGTLTVEGLN